MGMQTQIRIREARLEDRRAVAALCRAINPQDYIPDRWEDFVGEGWAFVAEAEAEGTNRLIGVAKAGLALDGQAWFGGMRVHPDWQRRGVGSRLGERCRQAVREAAHPRLGRMGIAAHNEPSLALAHKQGFREVARYALFHRSPGAPPLRGPVKSLQPIGDGDALWARLRADGLLAAHRFLIPCGYVWYRLDRALLEERFIRPGHALCVEGEGAVALALIDPAGAFAGRGEEGETEAFQIVYLSPQGEALIPALVDRAQGRGISAFVPDDPRLTEALRGHGFAPPEWTEVLVILEASLG